MKYLIEHLDPEVFDWCALEYTHMSEIVGKDNLIITNVSGDDAKKIEGIGELKVEKVKEGDFKAPCILDPYSDTLLTPEDAEKFDCMIFGGILGNNPAEKRTAQLTDHLPFETRNLGPDQLSTDTAVYVTKKILDGTPLSDIKFINEVEIEREEGESIVLPFKYVVENEKLIISSKLVEHIKEKGFE